MQLDDIRALVSADLTALNRKIQQELHTNVLLIDQMANYIIGSGGKRLRPILTLLVARGCGNQSEHAVTLAGVVEFIHTATLLHDDVVDESTLRRGSDTANQVWGNQASVLVGDFLYSRAFEMLVSVGSLDVLNAMAKATNTIAEGEVLQLLNCRDPDVTEARYFDVIDGKTAELFVAAARTAAAASDASAEIEQAVCVYAKALGRAFQLVDDLLDYESDADTMGKNVGDDLAEGKPTLPLIYARDKGDTETKQLIRNAIEEGGLEQFDPIMQAIKATGALTYTAECAKKEAQTAIRALQPFPASPYKEALIGLAHFAVERVY